MADDYYSTLNIPKTASAADVKKAYLKMARDNHPDRFKDPEEKKEADSGFRKSRKPIISCVMGDRDRSMIGISRKRNDLPNKRPVSFSRTGSCASSRGTMKLL